MAVDQYNATTGAPEFLESGAPQEGTDLTTVAAYAAARGTRLKGSTAARTAFAYHEDGIIWRDTTTGYVYESKSGAWTGGTAAITYAGIYSAGTQTPAAVRVENRVYLEGVVVSSSTTFLALTTYTIGTLPVGFRPPVARGFIVQAQQGYTQLTVLADGTINILLPAGAGFNAALSMPIDGVNFRVAT